MATRNIVPRADGEGGIGTSAKRWGLGYFDVLHLLEMNLVPTLASDGDWCGLTEDGTLGETISFGHICYFKAADSKWWKAKGDAAATATPLLGFCVDGGSADDASTFLILGKIRADALFPTGTVGATAFVSTATAGAIVATLPSKSTGHIIRAVGWWKTANDVMVTISPNWGEYA